MNAGARLRSKECASMYPIPCGFFSLVSRIDRDLYETLRLCLSTAEGLPFEYVLLNGTSAHSLWVSNFFVDVTRANPTFLPEIILSKANGVSASRHAVDANILLAWYMHLGGYIEEETSWAQDKSCVTVSSNFIWADLKFCPPVILWK